MKHISQVVFVTLLLTIIYPIQSFAQETTVNIETNTNNTSTSNSTTTGQSCVKVTINGKVEEHCTDSSGSIKYKSVNGESTVEINNDNQITSTPSSNISTQNAELEKKSKEIKKTVQAKKEDIKKEIKQEKFNIFQFLADQIQKIRNLFTLPRDN